MARYVDTALSPGEKILYDAKVHWAIFIMPILRAVFAVLALSFVFFWVGFGRPEGDLAQITQSISETKGLSFVGNFRGIGLFALIAIAVVGVGLVNALIYYLNSDFVLTDRRVISKFGLLSRTTSEQRLSKVESIHVYQSLLGRILGFGNITVTGTGSSATKFGPMVDPLACKRAIEGQLDLSKHSGPGE